MPRVEARCLPAIVDRRPFAVRYRIFRGRHGQRHLQRARDLDRALSKDRYVPAERVGTIVAGTIRLELGEDDTGGLQEYNHVPPSEEMLPPDRRA